MKSAFGASQAAAAMEPSSRSSVTSASASATSPPKSHPVPRRSPFAQLLAHIRPGRGDSDGPQLVAAATHASQSTGTDSRITLQQSRSLPKQPSHLLVLANGLHGTPANWNTIVEQLERHLDMKQVLIHPSMANTRLDTFDGIDVCGQRLADEMKAIVARNPSLERISVIGHSMGGLLVRYAIGVSYDPETKRIAGLEPCHFITMATPHLGCDDDGVAQVPFIGWIGVLRPLQSLLSAVSVPTAGVLFRRTGRQFFLADDDLSRAPGGGGLPLLARLTRDAPEQNQYFFSALASFATRTAYANTCQDHLVGWSNSSLRFMHQLPLLPSSAAKAKGVVLEDPLLAAFDVRFKPEAEPQRARSSGDLPISTEDHAGQQRQYEEQQRKKDSGLLVASHPLENEPSGVLSYSTSSVSDGPSGVPRSNSNPARLSPRGKMVEDMLQRLQTLAWRRIDCSFKGALMPFAHNHIQVTRRWLNFEGESVAVHLAQTFVQLDATLAAMQKADVKFMSEGQMPAAAASAASDQQGMQQPVSSQQAGASTIATRRSNEEKVASMRSIEEAVEQSALQVPAAGGASGLVHGEEAGASDPTGIVMLAGEGDVAAATSVASA